MVVGGRVFFFRNRRGVSRASRYPPPHRHVAVDGLEAKGTIWGASKTQLAGGWKGAKELGVSKLPFKRELKRCQEFCKEMVVTGTPKADHVFLTGNHVPLRSSTFGISWYTHGVVAAFAV